MAATKWSSRASLDGLRSVLDDADRLGAKNRFVDLVHRRALARHLPAEPRGVTLDFGCGVGRLTGWLALRSELVIGLEITPEMLVKARHRVTSPNAFMALFDGAAIPLADASIDRAVSVYVLQHVLGDDRLAALARELARVLVPGGRLVVIEQVRQDQPKELNGFLEQRLRSEYSRAFEDAGLRVGSSEPIRIRSRITTALSSVATPERLLARVADAHLAVARRHERSMGPADYLMTFDRPAS